MPDEDRTRLDRNSGVGSGVGVELEWSWSGVGVELEWSWSGNPTRERGRSGN